MTKNPVQKPKRPRQILPLPDPQSILLSDKEAAALASIGPSTLHKMAKLGTFPKPIRIGSKSVRWFRADIEHWISSLAPRGDSDA